MFSVGQNVFFKHPKHSWVCGVVLQEEKGLFSCKVDDAVRREVSVGVIDKLKTDDLATLQTDVLDDRPNDLLNLSILHDSTLLRCLYIRYMDDVVYTNIGAIVVALNPFNYNIERYKDDKMKNYLQEGSVIRHNIPHSWAQAHNTYYEMSNDRMNQTILISGESGAGKTEATKIVMKYLAEVSCLTATGDEKARGKAVGVKLSSCSPILESFGNARTVRNDNSSRFGKFANVKFDQNGRLIGALTTKYLLEKSRIVTAAQNERVYHSFYIVVRGKYRSQLGLENESVYASINSGNCTQNKEFNTAEDFDEVCGAMKGVGMTDDEIRSCWLLPAGVLCLLNVTFNADSDSKSVIDERTAKFLQQATRIWGIDEVKLRRELTTKTLHIPGQGSTTTRINITAAMDTRDALCKATYDGVFGWLVDKCNELCDVPATGNWVGLLDIFGFEDFEKNSFEQLCINLTNETLQNHYNAFIFTRDMDDCRAEGIDVAEIQCPDNGPCLALITQQGGIIPLLDQQCAVDGTDAAFLADVFAKHGNNERGQPKHVFLSQPKVKGVTFAIHHYAASVTYDVTGWLEKNRDTLRDELKFLMRSSANPIVKVVLPEPIPLDERKGKSVFTVGGFFKSQVSLLMEVINGTNPHWIRCVKPHPAKAPRMFDGIQTMNQLESSGVLGTVKIRKAGYPVRIPSEKFVHRYCAICPSSGSPKDIISAVLAACEMATKASSQIGKTKVFLKSDAYQKLEKRRELALLDYVVFLQRIGDGYRPRKKMFASYLEKHRAALLKAKREREERERAEAEAREKARREAEAKARLAREAEERRRIAEQKRLEAKRNKAATCIQRHIRGGLTRIRVFRQVLELTRAEFEWKREEQIMRERIAVKEVDHQRLRAERQWVAWLNEVDQLSRYLESENQRIREKTDQKDRIAKRELCRGEQLAREEMCDAESTERYTIQAKCVVVARHKMALESQQSQPQVKDRQGVHRRQPPVGGLHHLRRDHRPQAAASDAHADQVLADYALHRSRAFEENEFETPESKGFASRANAWEDVQRRQPPSAEKAHELFERSKRRWESQAQLLPPQDINDARGSSVPVVATQNPALSQLYSGPYRTLDPMRQSNFGRFSSSTGGRAPSASVPHYDPVSTTVDWNAVFAQRRL